jgi:glycosyltransferase involved in cell wall biosynthesis
MAGKNVALVMPCLNEAKHIAGCLDSIVNNDFPKERLRMQVIDGMSTDGTREIVKDYAQKHDFIELVDNRGALKSVGLNRTIRNITADVIIRVDAHSIYQEDYISTLVEGLERYHADNIGCIRETHIGSSVLQKAIGILIGHKFAVGNSHYRTGAKEVREVDTVFGGCFRRKVFDKIGYFNEKLVRTQDREFNYRLRQHGGKIVLDPSTHCVYFPRTKAGSYIRWNYQGAYWLFYARRFTRTKMLSSRNLVPIAFVLWHPLALAAFLANPVAGAIASLPIAAYWIMVGYHSFIESLKNKCPGLALVLPPLFAATHFSYGLGSLKGLLDAWLQGKDYSAESV